MSGEKEPELGSLNNVTEWTAIEMYRELVKDK